MISCSFHRAAYQKITLIYISMIEVKANMVSRKVGHQSFAEKKGPYSRSRETSMEPPRELKNLHISALNVLFARFKKFVLNNGGCAVQKITLIYISMFEVKTNVVSRKVGQQSFAEKKGHIPEVGRPLWNHRESLKTYTFRR